ncbi:MULTISPECIES: hypothetical protein [unclassified Moorena]|uniref:helix-turn-helix domain-containing protein n=1 Tax=unclassified Moorena TaxID=2683338 RepID=UPI0014017CFF|nr:MULTISPECIES: hypothetical protein [unclassified Moorena]NEO17650.1 transposase [Moorena sp. SIO3E8]NEQ04266.1 transposase [Moorena sp. SIO3F7]
MAIGQGSMTRLAKRVKVSRNFVFRIIKKFKETGNISPGKQGNNRASKLEPFTEFIKSMLSDHPSLTLSEMVEILEKDKQITVHITTLSRFLKKLNITRKKKFICQSS